MRGPFIRGVDLMQSIYWDIALILGLILASGLIAMSEFAISLARKSRLRDLANRGYRSAAVALRFERKPQGTALDGPRVDDALGNPGGRLCWSEPDA